MKLKHIMIIFLIVVVAVIGYYYMDRYTSSMVISDWEHFNDQYESLNGQDNGYGGTYQTLDLPDSHAIQEVEYETIKEILTSGTGVIYFGFPECPWCRNMVLPLIEASKVMEVSTVYYFNAVSIRDQKQLTDEGKIETLTDGTDEYYELLTLLGDAIGAYENLQDDTIKRLYFPTVVVVKDGNIVGSHIGTLDSHTRGTTPLTSAQTLELQELYEDLISRTDASVCDTTC